MGGIGDHETNNNLHLSVRMYSTRSHSPTGNFSGEKKIDEVIVARGNTLELLRIDPQTVKLVSVLHQPAFCVIRSMTSFRLIGSSKDYLAVGSDSGKVTVLEYNVEKNSLDLVHSETYGKTGCRRAVPGAYVAADPQGRALMICALEKQKFVYIMNRDANSRLTISSPLEAHKAQALCYATCALDVAFDNPIFAAIEVNYADADEDPTGEAAEMTDKHLVYYQLDLGLNHVVRVWSDPISRTSNLLLQVPGGGQGPSGVLVCGENWVAYKHQGHVEVRAPLPRRAGLPSNRGTLVTAGALHRQKTLFFFLLQSEYGDLYKVTLDLDDSKKQVKGLKVEVFDTIPPSTSMAITKLGCLFSASEFSNHGLYQFGALGGGEDAVFSSAVEDPELGDDSHSAATVAPEFTPQKTLTNLIPADEVESLAPLTDLLVGDLANELTPQLYATCGEGPRSSLRILRHGIAVSEMALSELPGRPGAVWALKDRIEDETVKLIVVSFSNATLILSVGETVEEVTDSGFLATVPTLECTLLANNHTLQIHGGGLRILAPGQPVKEWRAPGRKVVEKACTNERQAVIALAGGELVYFAIDDLGSGLQEVGTVELGAEVSCLELGAVPPGRVGSPFLAVGDWTGTVKFLSLSREGQLFSQLSMISAPASPESLRLMEMPAEGARGGGGEGHGGGGVSSTELYLFVGLSNGVMQRVSVDPSSGTLSDTRNRFCGAAPVKLFPLPVGGSNGILALSSRSWLGYSHAGKYTVAPLSYDPLGYACAFPTEHSPEGIVGIADNTLRIIAPEKLGEALNQQAVPLRYTPRQMAQLPGDLARLVIVETNDRCFNEQERAAINRGNPQESIEIEALSTAEMNGDVQPPPPPPPPPPPALAGGDARGGDDDEDMDVEMDVDDDNAAPPPPPPPPPPEEDREGGDEGEQDVTIPLIGPIPSIEGKWASCVRLVSPGAAKSIECLELDRNEAALSVAVVMFHSRGGEAFVTVGTAQGLTFHPRKATACYVHVYRVLENSLVLLHKTQVPDVPLALCEFNGRLLVGAGPTLRLYDLGKKKLLRKCESRPLPTNICSISSIRDRIVVGDMAESLHLVKYRRAENELVVFADDPVPRITTKCVMLDYDTAVGGDKFGNLFVLRVGKDVTDNVDNPTGNRMLWDVGTLSGASSKLDALAMFHVGSAITSISKARLVPGGAEAIIYATVTGGIGALLPFASREDVDFFTHLEMHMRQEMQTLCRREHQGYRSYYLPVRAVVDGDLCELFPHLGVDVQKRIAEGLDRTPSEVVKKLDDTRNRLL